MNEDDDTNVIDCIEYAFEVEAAEIVVQIYY
jgi:hypothetical protein